MTIIRSADVDREDFVFYADRIVRYIVEEGLNYVPCACPAPPRSPCRPAAQTRRPRL